jgi:hypothetical protein
MIGTLRRLSRGKLRGLWVGIGRVRWALEGRPDVGMYFKQERCRRIARAHGCRVLIETGTFLGDMVEAMRGSVAAIHSIELDEELFAQAVRRFQSAPEVHLYQGDSAEKLPIVLRQVSERAIIWLDGHYSGEGTGRGSADCPVLAELDALVASGRPDHCILIDDAADFGRLPGYPSLDAIRSRLHAINPAYSVQIENNCIIALPPG